MKTISSSEGATRMAFRTPRSLALLSQRGVEMSMRTISTRTSSHLQISKTVRRCSIRSLKWTSSATIWNFPEPARRFLRASRKCQLVPCCVETSIPGDHVGLCSVLTRLQNRWFPRPIHQSDGFAAASQSRDERFNGPESVLNRLGTTMTSAIRGISCVENSPECISRQMDSAVRNLKEDEWARLLQ